MPVQENDNSAAEPPNPGDPGPELPEPKEPVDPAEDDRIPPLREIPPRGS